MYRKHGFSIHVTQHIYRKQLFSIYDPNLNPPTPFRIEPDPYLRSLTLTEPHAPRRPHRIHRQR